MSTLPTVGKADPSLLPLRSGARSAVAVLLAWLYACWCRHELIDELRALPDAQLRDIGIERHRVGPSIGRDLDRLRSWR